MTKDVAKTPNRAEVSPSRIGHVQDAARPVLTHGRVMPAGTRVAQHCHPRSQLLWAQRGVLRVASEGSVWIVPPSHAVWIAGGILHQVEVTSEAETCNLYIDAAARPQRAERGCAVLLLTPLLRALILRLAETAPPDSFDDRRLRLCAVALDEIAALPAAPLSLPGGQDPRLVRLTAHLGQDPQDPRPLAALAQMAGASPRTLERLFRAETGLSFRQWRSRLRLLAAFERLGRGESSTAIAFSLGYASASAFVAAFRAQFGQPPQSYLRG